MTTSQTPSTSQTQSTSDRRRQRLLVVAPVAVAVVAIVVTSLVLADRLPAVVPSHWDTSGAVDDTMSLGALTAVLAVTTALVGGVLAAMVDRVGPPIVERTVAGLTAAVPLWLAGLHVAILRATVEATGAVPLPLAGAGVAALVAAGVGLAVGAAVPTWERPTPTLDVARVEVAPGEAVVWSGDASAPAWLTVLLGGVALVAVPLAVLVGAWPLAIVVLLVVGLALTVLRVRVTVGPAGVAVRTGPGGVLATRVGLDGIAAADVIDVDPLAFGGWGYRVMPGVRGVVLRSGPGLRVERHDAPTLVVTLDGAAEAAGVLRAHLAQHHDLPVE